MAIFATVNSSDDSDQDTNVSAEINLIDAQVALSQLISATREVSEEEPKLGLCDAARITLDIVNAAQRARNYHESCISIADQAYQLVNAVDAGIKGGAIDVNHVLRDHIVRLNVDLDQIRQTIKRLGSWWIFPRIWSAESELARCHTILAQEVEMYILLLRSSLAQFEPEKDAVHKAVSLGTGLDFKQTLQFQEPNDPVDSPTSPNVSVPESVY